MKTITLIILTAFCYMITPCLMANGTPQMQIVAQEENPVYYRLTLEHIFSEASKEKIETAFKDVYAPFVIDEIDYQAKVMVIKMTQKAPFDSVKQSFDKVGLRIVKDERIK